MDKPFETGHGTFLNETRRSNGSNKGFFSTTDKNHLSMFGLNISREDIMSKTHIGGILRSNELNNFKSDDITAQEKQISPWLTKSTEQEGETINFEG